MMSDLPRGGGLLGATARMLMIDFDRSVAAKSDTPKAMVIEALLSAGFEHDGHTKLENVRIPTRNSPVFGNSGGEIAMLGGRQRFTKPGAQIKATVGSRTTSLYRVDGKGINNVVGIATFATKDIAELFRCLELVKGAQ